MQIDQLPPVVLLRVYLSIDQIVPTTTIDRKKCFSYQYSGIAVYLCGCFLLLNFIIDKLSGPHLSDPVGFCGYMPGEVHKDKVVVKKVFDLINLPGGFPLEFFQR